MPRELKVFTLRGFALHADGFEPGELDRHRQIMMIVAARTKKRAQELFGVPSSEMNDYHSVTGYEPDIEVAMAAPEQVFARPEWRGKGAVYRPIWRDPHVPIPRRKKPPYLPYVSEIKFTRDELELIRDRFSMANDPDSQAVGEKAQKMLDRIDGKS